MSGADHALNRARRYLAADETLIASAVGYELEGRRRQVVMLTDRRVLVAELRGQRPLELGLDTTSASYHADGGRLRLQQDQQLRAVLRGVETAAGEQIVALLAGRHRLPPSALAGRVRHVQLRPRPPTP